MRIGRIILVSLIASAVALLPGRAQAIFHLAVIDEVLASLDGDEDQQFVEIRMLAAVQNFVSNSVLASFDEDGDYIEDVLLVPANVENAGADVRWTMATSEFQEEHSFTADFTMPAGLPVEGGMICWGAPGIAPPADPGSWDHTNPSNYVDCVAYGTYSGPTNGFIGTPTSLAPDGHGLRRVSETHDSATDFACADPLTPTNNQGASVSVPASEACAVERASGIQVTPDELRTLISKDVGGERWAITRNLDDGTVTGNVFFPAGGDPLFLFCEETDQSGDDLTFDCFGTNRCSDTSCPDFDFLSEVTLPESFFLPPEDASPLTARTASVAKGRAQGLGERASGIQITPDDLRTLISKDVGGERWAITRNLDDLTVTGNVFFPAGGDPLFIFCEQTGDTGDDLSFDCFGTERCTETCPEFEFLSEVTLPESFFAVPGSPPG